MMKTPHKKTLCGNKHAKVERALPRARCYISLFFRLLVAAEGKFKRLLRQFE